MKTIKRNIWMDIMGWSLLAIVLLVIIPMLYPAELPLVYHIYHIILFVVLFIVYYLNTNIIIPNVIKRGINLNYILLFLGICALVISLMNFIGNELNIRALVYQSLYPNEEYRPEEKKSYINYYLFFQTALVLSVGYINQSYRKWNLEELKNNELRERKAKAELETLKAQIQPHFFFNTLNTIYALTHTDLEKSQEAILKLSKMMRYVMNEENKFYVKLAEETSFIHNYLELMSHRLPKNVKLSYELTEEHPETQIAPMILLNFIENCFKHGVSTEHECLIKISTHFEGDYFVLSTENDWLKNHQSNKSKGIGINNSKKRLEIIYPEKHKLEYEVKKNRYHSSLKIKLV